MNKEIYWEKALSQSETAIKKGNLFPLKTFDITNEIYKKDDFIIRKLDLCNFKKNMTFGPKINPFNPWEKNLEIEKIGINHQLILNKYPVQIGHILLITNNWKPQNGWLDKKDWIAVKIVNNDTSGLWFFNSGPLAGASQPHRHLQLLRRSSHEKICPREDWFLEKCEKGNDNKLFYKNLIVKKFKFSNSVDDIYKIYLDIAKEIGLGNPLVNKTPLYPYNLLITNEWIAIIKRSIDYKFGFNVNALGFAGYILTTDESNIDYLKSEGPESLLKKFV